MEIRSIPPILLAALVAACTSTPSPTPPPTPTAAPPTPTALPEAATSPPPTVAPTSVPPTATALSATATSPPPTATPATETAQPGTDQGSSAEREANVLTIEVGDNVLTATLVDNSSVDALKEALSEGPIIIDMRDYGDMEKVGSLGMELPRNDEQITTEAGDLILYQGGAFVIYYAPNSWNFTRLGKINNVTAEELREILGEGDVTVTLSLAQE